MNQESTMSRVFLALLCVLSVPALTLEAGSKTGLKSGTPDIKSAGPLAFGPSGVLFIGDTQSAAVFAVDTGAAQAVAENAKINVNGINEKIAAMLGTSTRDVLINDLAVKPKSGTVYLSIQRGQGAAAVPLVLKVDSKGTLSELKLQNIPFAMVRLPNPPAPGGTGRRNRRRQSITDLAFVDGRVLVAGLSNEDFASNLRSIPFPFEDANRGASIEIFHGAHGRFETNSPVRTFVPFNIGGKPHLLAAYTCTPLVKFPLAELQPGKQIKGTTVAELGNRNNPLDMIVYKKGDQHYLLIANTSRGVMKVTTTNLSNAQSITKRVSGGASAGIKYETIKALKGVTQLDRLDNTQAVILTRNDEGLQNVHTIALP
jgi:hypothetical protein